jgi:hypothetical protein
MALQWKIGSYDSSVNIVRGCRLDGQGFIHGKVAGNFLFATAFILALGPSQHPFEWARVNLSTVVKRPEHKANQSPSPGAYVNNVQNYTFTPQYVFMAWCSQGLYIHGCCVLNLILLIRIVKM